MKSTRDGPHGLPYISLRCPFGSKPTRYRQYTETEADFIVGYDMPTDTCYVWSIQEVMRHRTSISISPDAAERWDKFSGV